MQISEELVKYITSELLKRINAERGRSSLFPAEAFQPPLNCGGALPLRGKGTGPASSAPAAKPLLHLVGRREDLSTPDLMKIQDSFEVVEHKLWEDPLPREASVLITSLGIQALVRVAEGDEGCTVEGRALLTALLNGQPVCALTDGLVWRRYQGTAPRGLLAKYAHYENVLAGYGLKFAAGSDVVEALLGRRQTAPAALGFSPAQAQPQASARPGVSGGRRVISENEIMAQCPVGGGEGQTLRLGPADIMTPLAQDYAKAMKINVVRN